MNPYNKLGPSKFWKLEVATKHFSEIDLASHRFDFKKFNKISAYGSCFAQRFITFLRDTGDSFLDCELSPNNIPPSQQSNFGYGLYSSRSGNIYTSRHLLQELEFATNKYAPEAFQKAIFEKEGRFFDGLRPNIWPSGVADPEIIISDRHIHASAFAKSIMSADLLVLTFGLTENWIEKESGLVLPLVPGVHFGQFDSHKFVWTRENVLETISNLQAFVLGAKALNSRIEIVMTVSPQPMIATYSPDNVLVANCNTKSCLRSAIQTVADESNGVSYFPSYEFATNPASRFCLFEQNLRTISKYGVDVIVEAMVGESFQNSDQEFICDEESLVDD